MSVRKQNRSGFTLVEIVFSMTLIVLLAALSLWTLRPANAKAPTRGLAAALSEEISAARQLAISSGRPVALGIPVDSGRPIASSVYRLEGWNTPTITWSKGFSGDYPNCGFAAARWSGGGTWTTGAPGSVVSKLGLFQLTSQWLPSGLADDYIFCFTPDGGLVTNGLPALDGRYPVVVGQNLTAAAGASGAQILGAKDAVTLLISPYGGVETVTGIPGGTVPETSAASNVTSAPRLRTNFAPGEVRLSNIIVRPNLTGAADDEGYCVPGQYVTMEVYAYDPQGRGLFAKWKQGTRKGIFTYPNGGAGAGAILESEVDRMEFVQAPVDDPARTDDDITWTGTTPPPGGLFRARWGWTVPMDSQPNDKYEIEVDVKDAKGECEIVNPPTSVKLTTAPKGSIIAEKRIGGRWQLVRMNPDGSGQRIISPPGIEETMASIDKTGNKMAFLQGDPGNRYVKVRALEGGFERTIAGPGNFTAVALSPDGAWISYHLHQGAVTATNPVGGTASGQGGRLYTKKLDDPAPPFEIPQTWGGTPPNPPRSRPGFSPDSKYLLYEFDTKILYRHLASGTEGVLIPEVGGTERLFAPTSYVQKDASNNEQDRVMFTVGNINPVSASAPIIEIGGNHLQTQLPGPLGGTGYAAANSGLTARMLPDLDGLGTATAGSGSVDDCYPMVAFDGSYLAICQSPNGTNIENNQTTQILLNNTTKCNFVGPPRMTIGDNTRRAVFVPAKAAP